MMRLAHIIIPATEGATYVKVSTPVIEATGKDMHVIQRWLLHRCITSTSNPQVLITGNDMMLLV